MAVTFQRNLGMLVVRQYSHRCANPVANTSRTERSVGLARTLNDSIVLRVETQNCNRPSTRGQIDLTLPSVAKARSPGTKESRHGRREAATVGAAAGHGRCSCALLYRLEGDFCRDACRRTRAGADAPHRRSAGEWRRVTHRSTELGETTGHRGRRRCPLRAHPRTSSAR
jgi:hypothetical protein